jgi:hypothetical protein
MSELRVEFDSASAGDATAKVNEVAAITAHVSSRRLFIVRTGSPELCRGCIADLPLATY